MRFGPYLTIVIVLLSIFSCSHKENKDFDPTEYVNPLIGTDWVGNTYPGASLPFGMVQLSPDNGKSGWNYISGYYYPDTMIVGFSHTHLSGTGAGDLYDIRFMPLVKDSLTEKISPEKTRLSFSHKEEKATAGYYSVKLQNGIKVELTATEHCGIQRYTHQDDIIEVRLDLDQTMNWDKTNDCEIKMIDNQTIEGYRFSDGWAKDQKVFFRTHFSRPIDLIVIDSIPKYSEEDTTQITGHGLIAHFTFEKKEPQDSTLIVKTSISGVDKKGAKLNLLKEAIDYSFEELLAQAKKTWQKTLSSILVSGSISRDIDTIFYTALYHSLLSPTIFSDVDGRYLGPDKKIHRQKEGDKYYSTFSLWDTYRAAHPLYNLLFPNQSRNMIESLINFGEQNNGRLPIWSMWASETNMMIGYHSIPVIVEACRKGIYKDNPQRIMRLLLSTADSTKNPSLKSYQKLGYVAAEQINWSLSKTMEYAYDDACISLFARETGGEAKKALEYTHRAQSYKNTFDHTTGFFRPKLSTGEWIEPFDPFEYSENIAESNAWQYLFSVQHDFQGLIELMGGKDSTIRKLDAFFQTATPSHIDLPIFSTGMIGQYAHGNEPGHHTVYLYNRLSQPWKSAKILRQILTKLYKNTPDGLCGNDDCGQLSAWYVFSSMGFYPVDPISGIYELGTPLFTNISIPQPNGRVFRLTAHDLSHTNQYIGSVKIDGQPYHHSYITWNQIRSGIHIELFMTAREGQCWY